jgi:dihydrolipoamide dehydrogenase
LNLESVGIPTDPWGFITVNDNLQTSVPHVYAVGDVGRRNTPLDLALVQVAEAEGRMAVKHIRGETIDIHPEHVPFIIFTMPMIAGAGLTETQARERYGRIRIAKFLTFATTATAPCSRTKASQADRRPARRRSDSWG